MTGTIENLKEHFQIFPLLGSTTKNVLSLYKLSENSSESLQTEKFLMLSCQRYIPIRYDFPALLRVSRTSSASPLPPKRYRIRQKHRAFGEKAGLAECANNV